MTANFEDLDTDILESIREGLVGLQGLNRITESGVNMLHEIEGELAAREDYEASLVDDGYCEQCFDYCTYDRYDDEDDWVKDDEPDEHDEEGANDRL